VDWSVLSCSWNGHLTFAPDEPSLRAEFGATLPGDVAWRCLRCGTFVPGPATMSGPAASAPMVARGKEVRSKLILRLFALERYARVLLFGALAVALWRFVADRASIEAALNRNLPVVRDIFKDLGIDITHSRLYGLVLHALNLSGGTALLLAIGVTAYAAIEAVEGTGLWLARRWGEYFAMIATSLGLPLEIYDLTRKVSVLALVLLAVNLALVLYLVITKRLFGVRGGKAAYDARLRSESVLEAAENAVAARRPAPVSASAVSRPTGASTSSATSATAGASAGPDSPPGPASQR
jgi:uncharacterized membrane protein (DUF2068 family)